MKEMKQPARVNLQIHRTILSLLIMGAMVLCLMLLVEVLSAETLYVDGNAGDDGDGTQETPFNRIQDAINAAEGRDSIRVYEGVYKENVIINRTVNVIGNGSGSTAIDGEGSDVVVKVTANWVNISGFKIIGGGGTTWPPEQEDAGIKVEADHVQIFENNCSFNGWTGILLTDAHSSRIFNNTINSNNDNGIKLVSSHHNVLSGNNISKNNGSGIKSLDSDHNSFTNNTITGNWWRGIFISGPSTRNECHYNIITSNRRHGLAVGVEKGGSGDKYLINATHNYWGSDAGPYHKTKNPL